LRNLSELERRHHWQLPTARGLKSLLRRFRIDKPERSAAPLYIISSGEQQAFTNVESYFAKLQLQSSSDFLTRPNCCSSLAGPRQRSTHDRTPACQLYSAHRTISRRRESCRRKSTWSQVCSRAANASDRSFARPILRIPSCCGPPGNETSTRKQSEHSHQFAVVE